MNTPNGRSTKYRNHNLRKGRTSIPRAYYHIIINTYRRQQLLANDNVASIIFETFDWLETESRLKWICIMIMPDHVHAIIELGTGQTLPKVLHSPKLFTARKINKYLSRRGHFWQPEYREWGVRNEAALNNMIRYCYVNPVKKGLVERPRDYPYWRCKYEMDW